MDEAPVLHDYQASDREEVFDFIREVFPADDSARIVTQWHWKLEANPFTPLEGPDVSFMRIGGKIVGLSAAFGLPMWMGGIECHGEGRGIWVVHPDYRNQNLWLKVKSSRPNFAPVQFGWTRLPGYVALRQNRPSDPLRPFLRVLDAGPLIDRFTHSRALAWLGTAATTVVRSVSSPLHRSSGTVARLNSFDDRADRLWERARRADRAMIVRDHRYLNWRYCQRPDATYSLFGIERGAELDGFLVARTLTFFGMRWGFLVDFLAPQSTPEALSSLIEAALDDFRAAGVGAVTCYATDPSVRSVLFRRGFFIVPQRKPIRFMRYVRAKRTDLAQFRALQRWYLTMGDGDLEMTP